MKWTCVKTSFAMVVAVLFSISLNGCAGMSAKKEQADYAFNKAYIEYRDKRPNVDPVQMNPEILSLIPNMDDKTIADINEKAKCLSKIYSLSTICADMYFDNAELENFKIKKTNQWNERLERGEFKDADFETVKTEYESFIRGIYQDNEYAAILDNMKKARSDYVCKAKELGKEVIIEALKKCLNAKDVMAARPKNEMNMLEKATFLKSLKNEAEKVYTILNQCAYTGIGTGLIIGQATTKIVLTTVEVGGVVVTVALEATGEVVKLVASAVDASGKAVELAMQGGALVIKATGEVVLSAADFTATLCQSVGYAISSLAYINMNENDLLDRRAGLDSVGKCYIVDMSWKVEIL